LEPKSQALHLDGHRRGHHQEDRAGAGQDGADQAQIHPAPRGKEGGLTVKLFKGHYTRSLNCTRSTSNPLQGASVTLSSPRIWMYLPP
ncbi:MAG: hypothetical protein ACREYE_29870, partial [Gammaproteobacteria bacterium]